VAEKSSEPRRNHSVSLSLKAVQMITTFAVYWIRPTRLLSPNDSPLPPGPHLRVGVGVEYDVRAKILSFSKVNQIIDSL
jgi:hypothetical protein